MASPSYYYDDPAKHIRYKREKTCKGCIHKNGKSNRCNANSNTYPLRCEQFYRRKGLDER